MRRLEGYQKGVNLGGWLSQGSLTKEHLDTFITEKDIERIASWGADHVRLPLDYENVETEDGTDIEAGYRYIENCVSWCLICTKLMAIFSIIRTIPKISSTARSSRNDF